MLLFVDYLKPPPLKIRNFSDVRTVYKYTDTYQTSCFTVY